MTLGSLITTAKLISNEQHSFGQKQRDPNVNFFLLKILVNFLLLSNLNLRNK